MRGTYHGGAPGIGSAPEHLYEIFEVSVAVHKDPMTGAATSSRHTETAKMRSGEGLSAIRGFAIVGPCVVSSRGSSNYTAIGARGISLRLIRESTARHSSSHPFAPHFVQTLVAVHWQWRVLFQAILRNLSQLRSLPGSSSPSTLGAVAAIWLGLDVVVGHAIYFLFAFAGALLTVFLVFSSPDPAAVYPPSRCCWQA
jgi:hypothetical protein